MPWPQHYEDQDAKRDVKKRTKHTRSDVMDWGIKRMDVLPAQYLCMS